MVLYFETIDFTDSFSLFVTSLDFLNLMIEMEEKTMDSINIVVEIGCYGGIPDDRVNVSKLKAML